MASASLWPSRSTGGHLSDGAKHSELYLQEHLWNVVSGFPASALLEGASGERGVAREPTHHRLLGGKLNLREAK